MRDEELFIPLAFVIGVTVVFVTKIIVGNVTQVVCHWRDTALKERMVEAGMSAPEIAEVVAAGRGSTCQHAAKLPEYHKPPVMKPAQ